MRILLVSKFAGITGGVEEHLATLIDGLSKAGHETCLVTSEELPGGSTFLPENSAIGGRLKSAGTLLWSSRARRLVQERVVEFHPDVVHYHSLYHQVSPSVIDPSLPAILTAHDYKLSAPCYELFRNGRICTQCVGRRVPLPAIRYRCIKDSRTASLLCVSEAVAHRHLYQRVERLIVPSRFAQQILVGAGYRPENISVIPWAVRRGEISQPIASGSVLSDDEECEASTRAMAAKPYLLYVGRFTQPKGVDLLVEAWGRSSARSCFDLVLAGRGPLADRIDESARVDQTISNVGFVDRRSVDQLISGASAVVMPSVWPETFGLSAMEALQLGTPLICSNEGALADLAGPGVLQVDPIDFETLTNALDQLTPGSLRTLSDDLAARDLSPYSLENMISSIVAEYEAAVSLHG